MLRRVATCLPGHGRVVQEFVRHLAEPSHVVVFTDSDHAGCLKTRKSTSSSKLFYGYPHATFHQHHARSPFLEFGRVRCLRSGAGNVSRLGAVSMLMDLGVDINNNTNIEKSALEARIDASAGRGIAVWRGAGRFRHVATPTSWAQHGIVEK